LLAPLLSASPEARDAAPTARGAIDALSAATALFVRSFAQLHELEGCHVHLRDLPRILVLVFHEKKTQKQKKCILDFVWEKKLCVDSTKCQSRS
jgi:hypothetical protein